MTPILITGVGGPVGQAIVKAARLSRVPCTIVGIDQAPLSVGLGWVDFPAVIPGVKQTDAYLKAITQLCDRHKIRLIMPGSEGELVVLAEHAAFLREQTGALVVASSSQVLQITLDKWNTCQFLRDAGLNFPDSAKLEDKEPLDELVKRHGFPLFAKPLQGSGSQGAQPVRSREELDRLRQSGRSFVVQEYLQPQEEEYTTAVYRQSDGKLIKPIVMKRQLLAGNTYRAWVSDNPAVAEQAEAVVRALGASGPCNVQLRLTSCGAVPFEINARFSGTCGMRAHFGYNEVEMALRDLVLQETIPEPSIQPGSALRFWDEAYYGPSEVPGQRRMDCNQAPI